MILTVVIPRMSTGVARMLQRELENTDHEILMFAWKDALALAQGDFICLLEEDSAFKPGTLLENLKLFTENPSYRKLAMVSSPVDYDERAGVTYLTYDKDVGLVGQSHSNSTSTHAARIGYVPGAIIRKSSLLRSPVSWAKKPLELSTDLSVDFWDRGLRILVNPETVYYAPVEQSVEISEIERTPRASTFELWNREMISA